MAADDVAAFVAAAHQSYYAPGEIVASPADGPAPRLVFIRRGAVSARGGVADLSEGGIHYDQGDLFPAAAIAAARAVSATYEAVDDLFCLEISAETARALAARSAVWADFLAKRAQRLLELSRAALQAEQGAQALAEHSLESPLANLPRKAPVSCAPGTPLVEVLKQMHTQRVGSVLVVDADGVAQGILTRHDVLERVALARPAEATPIERVMSAPVRTLPIHATAQQAALAMSRHGVRHLPLTDEAGRVVSIVSERDLFALQRLLLKHVSGMIRAVRSASDRAALVACGEAILRLARHLLTGRAQRPAPTTVRPPPGELRARATQQSSRPGRRHGDRKFVSACAAQLGFAGAARRNAAPGRAGAVDVSRRGASDRHPGRRAGAGAGGQSRGPGPDDRR